MEKATWLKKKERGKEEKEEKEQERCVESIIMSLKLHIIHNSQCASSPFHPDPDLSVRQRQNPSKQEPFISYMCFTEIRDQSMSKGKHLAVQNWSFRQCRMAQTRD